MSTYRKFFNPGDNIHTNQKSEIQFNEMKDKFQSPIKENNYMSDNLKFLNIPHQFSNISHRYEDSKKIKEMNTFTKTKTLYKSPNNDDKQSSKILVVGFDPIYSNFVLSSFKKYGKILDFEYKENTNFLIINFSTIREAKYALEHYNKFVLNISKENIIVAEPICGELRPLQSHLEENSQNPKKREDKFNRISIPSNLGYFKFFEYFNW